MVHDPDDKLAILRDRAERARSGLSRAEDFTVGVVVDIREGRKAGRWVIASTTGCFGFALVRIGKRGQRLMPKGRNVFYQSPGGLVTLGAVVVGQNEAPKAREPETAPEGAPSARRFSTVGPCIHVGMVVRETARFLVVNVRTSDGVETRRFGKGDVHAVPCRSCWDHPQTHYPRGYEN